MSVDMSTAVIRPECLNRSLTRVLSCKSINLTSPYMLPVMPNLPLVLILTAVTSFLEVISLICIDSNSLV